MFREKMTPQMQSPWRLLLGLLCLGLILLGGTVAAALLQTSCLAGGIPRRFVTRTSSRLEVERFLDEGDSLGKRRGTETERSFDNARLAVYVAREIEDCCLPLA